MKREDFIKKLHPAITHINASDNMSEETLDAINIMVERASKMSSDDIKNLKKDRNYSKQEMIESYNAGLKNAGDFLKDKNLYIGAVQYVESIDGITTEKDRVQFLKDSIGLTKTGFAGILPNGNKVDRRKHPDAIPLAYNRHMGIPEPKKMPNLKEARTALKAMGFDDSRLIWDEKDERWAVDIK